MALRRQHLILFSKPLSYLSSAGPAALSAPSVSGRGIEGYVLTAVQGTYTDALFVTGQWYRDAVTPISGEHALTYRLTSSDIGFSPFYRETAEDALGHITVQDTAATGPVISGVILRVALRLSAADMSAWAKGTYCLQTDAYPTTRGGNVFGYLAAGAHATNQGASALPVQGQASISGVSGRYQFSTGGVTEQVRVKLAVGGAAAGRTESFSIRNGDTATVLSFKADTVLANATDILVGDGTTKTLATYDQDTGVLVTPTSGSVVVRRNGAAGFMDLRYLEITYPDFAQITFGTGPYYADTAGANTALGTSAGTAWSNVAGDPGAVGGAVSAFNVLADGQMLLKKGQIHRPASYTGRANRHLQTRVTGTAGHVVTFGAYDSGAAPQVVGDQLLTSWSAVAAPDGVVYLNPNHANIEKKAVTGASYFPPIYDGDDWLFPAQWPYGSNPADYDWSYPGTDWFRAMDDATYASCAVTQGADNSGTGGVGCKCSLTDTLLATQYGADAVDLTGYTIMVLMTGARVTGYTIVDHNPATGYIEWDISNRTVGGIPQATLQPSSATQGVQFIYAIRGCPYDIRQVGQYAYKLDASEVYGHFATATRSISRLYFGFRPDHDYNVVDGLHFKGFSYGSTSDGSGVIAAFNGSQTRVGLQIKNTRISHSKAIGRVLAVTRPSAGVSSSITGENITVDNIQGCAGVQWECDGGIDGLYVRDGSGTAFLTQIAPSTRRVLKNFDLCDMTGIHQDGVAIYAKAALWTLENHIILNQFLPVSLQQDNSVADRSLILKNMAAIGRRQFPGAAFPQTLNTVAIGENETNSLFEGLLIPGRWFYGRSSANTNPAYGMVVKNCVIGDWGCYDVVGIRFENCVFMNQLNNGQIKVAGDIVTRGGTDDGGNVYLAANTAWTGEITEDMQKALTKDGAAATYTTRNVGKTAGKMWTIPGWGTAFTLADQDPWLSTSVCRRRFRAHLDFAVIGGYFPMTTLALPAGQGDNDTYFELNQSYAAWKTAPLTAGTYNLVVDFTNTHPDRTGSATRRVTFSVTVY